MAVLLLSRALLLACPCIPAESPAASPPEPAYDILADDPFADRALHIFAEDPLLALGRCKFPPKGHFLLTSYRLSFAAELRRSVSDL